MTLSVDIVIILIILIVTKFVFFIRAIIDYSDTNYCSQAKEISFFTARYGDPSPSKSQPQAYRYYLQLNWY